MRSGVQEKSAKKAAPKRQRNGGLLCALLPQFGTAQLFFFEKSNGLHEKRAASVHSKETDRSSKICVLALHLPNQRSRFAARRAKTAVRGGPLAFAAPIACVAFCGLHAAEMAAFSPPKVRVKQSFIESASGSRPGQRRELCHVFDILFHSPMPSPIRRSGRE